ncbi:SLAP domain-containing protein [Lactobacillus sp.]|uniref:SLAP domain-containing protein n=1 Tax=Lactobacillus sp. TaxID=1591 RepID=UPI0019C02F60|nr:SLAP domain-containing protein [Lactobacillus sp.]MBD5430273.1 cell surface protein [Lactobacillus sp.]
MKFNKKIAAVSIAALLTVSPSVLGLVENNITVQAATKSSEKQVNTIKLTNNLNGVSIPVYDKNGKKISKPTTKLEVGKTIKIIGEPVLLNGEKYYSGWFPSVAIIKENTYVWLGDNGYIKSRNMGTSNEKTGVITISRNSYVYDKNGQRLKTYRGGKAYIKAGTKITSKQKRTYYIPQTYFEVGKGEYVRAAYVTEYNGKGLLGLSHNSYIYDKNGKRLNNFNGQKNVVLKAGSIVSYTGKITNATNSSSYYFYNTSDDGTAKTSTIKTIKGQEYYAIGNGGYIKAANVNTINGHVMYTNKPTYVTLETDVYGYDENFKQNKTVYKRGQKVKVSKSVIDRSGEDPQLYFQVSGKKNQLIYWGDYGEYPGVGLDTIYDPNSNYQIIPREFLLNRN